MNPKSLARLAKLVGMLKSPFEPEAESAQAAIDRWLTKHGKTLADLESLLELAPRPAPSRITEAELATGWAASAAEYRARRRRFAVDADEDPDDDEESAPPIDRDAVLAEANQPGANIAAVARRHGLEPSTLRDWRRKQPDAIPKYTRRTAEDRAKEARARQRLAKKEAAIAARSARQLERDREREARRAGGDLLGERLGFRDRVAAGEQ